MSHAVRNNAVVVPAAMTSPKLRAKSHCQLTATSGASRQSKFSATIGAKGNLAANYGVGVAVGAGVAVSVVLSVLTLVDFFTVRRARCLCVAR